MKFFRLTLAVCVLLPLFGGCGHQEGIVVPVDSMCQRARRMEGFTTIPVSCSGKDQDKDGIDDAADLCPLYPETANNEYDLDGCPDPDSDGDFVVDYQDACPRTPGAVPDGCPMLDADNDGIADHLDSCPLEREDIDGEFDQDGCPEGAYIYATTIEGLTVYRAETFLFKNKSFELTKEEINLIQEISDSLLGQIQHVPKVQVDVYVAKGESRTKEGRRALAQKRVNPVTQAMLRAGLDRALIHQVYFEIDHLSQKGPRVELIILWQEVLTDKEPNAFQQE